MSSRPWGRPGCGNPCIDRPQAGRRGRCGHRSIRRKSFFVDPCRGGAPPPAPGGGPRAPPGGGGGPGGKGRGAGGGGGGGPRRP
ncbi:hypothetical protein EJU38_17945, partial [Pseudomonas aeruginosa]